MQGEELPGVEEEIIKAGFNDSFSPVLVLIRLVELLTQTEFV